MVPLVFHILDESDFRTKSESSSVTHAEVAKIINRSENFGLWVLDLDSGQLRWSNRTFEIFGIEERKNPVNSKDVAACYHPDDRVLIGDLFERCIDQRESFNRKFPITTIDGR